MQKEQFEFLRSGDYITVEGFKANILIEEAEVYGHRACSITLTGGHRMKIDDDWVRKTYLDKPGREHLRNLLRRGDASTVIKHLNETQMRIALFAIEENHTLPDALQLALEY